MHQYLHTLVGMKGAMDRRGIIKPVGIMGYISAHHCMQYHAAIVGHTIVDLVQIVHGDDVSNTALLITTLYFFRFFFT